MQEFKVLEDICKSGKKVNWQGHKTDNLLLSDSYKRIGETSKAVRCSDCGCELHFERLIDGSMRLKHASFCKVRLCPMCAWRRTMKIFAQTSQVMDYITENKDLRYLFLTLTVKNVQGNELSQTIDALFEAYKKLTKSKEFKKMAKGFFRCLEVTHKWERGDDYHPHFHVIIAVNKSYFVRDGKNGYITHKAWMQLWRECAGLDYDPQVYIEAVKPKNGEEGNKDYGKAVAEVAKYTIKAGDFIMRHQFGRDISPDHRKRLEKWANDETDKVVKVLDKALANRRLVAFGGVMRDVHKLLNLDKPEDGDLVNTGYDVVRADLVELTERYKWSVGFRNYVLEEAN